MLTVVCWKWGTLFSAVHVNRLRAALARHLTLKHELVCITDTDPAGIDPRVRIMPQPITYARTPRCRRRMQIFDRDFARRLGDRLLCLDLDVVLVDDITPIVDRADPLVCWRVEYSQVFSGSVLLMNAGVLQGLWERFAADPEGYPRSIQARGTPSDQAMLNAYLRSARAAPAVAVWTEADGFVTYFGAGYERFASRGVGPSHPTLPLGARIVVLGSADLADVESGRYAWANDHWLSLPVEWPL